MKLLTRVSPLPPDGHRRILRLISKTKTPSEMQCVGTLSESLIMPLDAHRRVPRLMLKSKNPCELQCMGTLNESLIMPLDAQRRASRFILKIYSPWGTMHRSSQWESHHTSWCSQKGLKTYVEDKGSLWGTMNGSSQWESHHRRVSRLMLKTKTLDAHRRVSQLMSKAKTLCQTLNKSGVRIKDPTKSSIPCRTWLFLSSLKLSVKGKLIKKCQCFIFLREGILWTISCIILLGEGNKVKLPYASTCKGPTKEKKY